MPRLSFVTLDVFTTTRFAGNPLAVVKAPSGHDISTSQMQTIAREFNLSETLFLHEKNHTDDGVPEWKVRIFLTNHEVPFAGHPTIGAACYALGTLAGNTKRGRLICNAGPILVDYADGVAKASIPHNFHRHQQYPFSEEDLYRLQPGLKGAQKPQALAVLSPVKGMNFVSVELQDLEALGKVEVCGVKPTPKLDDAWNVGFAGSLYYVIVGHCDGKVQIRARMIEGAFEDPGTGSACCALSSYLALEMKSSRTMQFEITQAVEMGRKNDIGVAITLKDSMDALEKVELSGSAVQVMEGEIQYD